MIAGSMRRFAEPEQRLRPVIWTGRVSELTQDLYFGEWLIPLWCGDILDDGSQALAYETFSGGAHCCFSAIVALLDSSGRHLLERRLGNSPLGPPQQLGTGRSLQLVADADVFAYFGDLSFVNSPYLPLIFVYDGSNYVEADATLPAIKAKLTPAAAAWLDAHAAEARQALAQVYNLAEVAGVQAVPDAAGAVPRLTTGAPAVPDTLSDSTRADISGNGRLVQRTPPSTYDETYTVEYLNGSWIVTKNDLS
jgi:hypothetical protein